MTEASAGRNFLELIGPDHALAQRRAEQTLKSPGITSIRCRATPRHRTRADKCPDRLAGGPKPAYDPPSHRAAGTADEDHPPTPTGWRCRRRRAQKGLVPKGAS